jgi:thiamine biosynthesis lipoprotein
MAQVLGLAAFIQSETGGAFDVNYLGLGRRSGSRARSRVRLRPLTTLLFVDTEGPGFEVTRLRPEHRASAAPLDLDFGALGKGYALDAALAVLSDWDIGNVLLHAGTSTALAAGPGPGKAKRRRGWSVGVGAAAGALAGSSRIVLENRCLSGSGTEVKGDHIIDPRTGRPARGHFAAWASHPSAAAADALSTAFLVMATGEVAGFCRRHPEVWALVKKEPKKCRIFNAGAAAALRPARRRRRR